MLRVFTAAVVVLLTVACYGQGQPEVQQNQASNEPLQILENLPALPREHTGSAVTGDFLPGYLTHARSSNAFDDDNKLLLLSGTNHLAWGLWRINPSLVYIDSVEAAVDIPPGDEVWLAVSDYQRNMWDIKGPFTEDYLLTIDDSRHRSVDGDLYVLAIAAYGAQPTIKHLSITCETGWVIVSVDSEGDVGRHSSLALVGGNPAISYYDSTNGDLKYAYSSTATGSRAEDWTTSLVDNGYENDVGQYTSLAVVDGQPAISYYDATAGALRYAKRNPGWPTGTWSRIVVDTNDAGMDVGKYSSLAVIEGRPMIAYYDETNDHLRHAVSLTETGASSDDWVTYLTDGTGETGKFCCIAEVDGKAAVSYGDKQAGDLLYKWFSNPAKVAVAEGEYLCKATSLAVVDGVPAIGFLSGQHLMYALSSTPQGTSPDDWQLVDVSSGSYCYGTSLAVVDGRPALCYCDNDELVYESSIIFAWSATTSGAYQQHWEEVVVVEEGSPWTRDEGLSLGEVDGKPAISYYERGGDQLKYAIRIGR